MNSRGKGILFFSGILLTYDSATRRKRRGSESCPLVPASRSADKTFSLAPSVACRSKTIIIIIMCDGDDN